MATYTDLKLEKTIIFQNGSERGATITQVGFSKFVNPAILYYKENNSLEELRFMVCFKLFFCLKKFFFPSGISKKTSSHRMKKYTIFLFLLICPLTGGKDEENNLMQRIQYIKMKT